MHCIFRLQSSQFRAYRDTLALVLSLSVLLRLDSLLLQRALLVIIAVGLRIIRRLLALAIGLGRRGAIRLAALAWGLRGRCASVAAIARLAELSLRGLLELREVLAMNKSAC